MSLEAQDAGIRLSEVFESDLRRTDGMSSLRIDGRQQSSPREELSPSLPGTSSHQGGCCSTTDTIPCGRQRTLIKYRSRKSFSQIGQAQADGSHFSTPASPAYQNDCESCSFPFPPLPTQTQINTASNRSTSSLAEKNAISPTGRYLCTKCRKHFCLDCDVLVHTSLGFCPGCV